ncbi:MAG: ATP-dependent DNA helicase UvrD2, partial [Corynebacterium sp.]|nr:ATP-dependent DNA helicase UvrD2 [Corynebacterium sp.]
VPASEIAVLYRINAQSAVFEQALSDAGIMYQVRGGEGFFTRSEIRQALTQLVRASQRDVDDTDLVRLVRRTLVPLGLSTEEPEGAQERERWQSLNALVDLVEELIKATPDLDFPGLLRKLHERQESKHPPTVEGVTLASLHAAKGLEWDAVFLVGLVDSTLPISHAIKAGDEAIEEERRLFYVGVTRAREHLHCSWALSRQEGGRKSRKRTRFLDGIVFDMASESGAPRANRPRNCRSCGNPLDTPAERVVGRCGACPPEADEQVYEQLRTWRNDTARRESVPAYVVFSNATLMAIAEMMPADENELLNVPGIGPMKIEKYGEQILNILAS